MVPFLQAWNPDPLQQSLRQELGKLSTVPPICLHKVTILYRQQTRGRHDTFDASFLQPIMKPEAKVSGFIHDLDCVLSVSLEYPLKRLPPSWDASVEELDGFRSYRHLPPQSV
jgi:hypothetical protein